MTIVTRVMNGVDHGSAAVVDSLELAVAGALAEGSVVVALLVEVLLVVVLLIAVEGHPSGHGHLLAVVEVRLSVCYFLLTLVYSISDTYFQFQVLTAPILKWV